MAFSGPSTPEHRNMHLNRSFTLPTKLARTSRTVPEFEIGASESVETLFVHPDGKVVKFSTSGASRPSSSAGPGARPGTSSGTLPWTSLTEQTVAMGQLEVYKVPGSVSFLHSGSLLQAILKRSNCWCVDGASKFALRVMPDMYYRIELPGDTPEDLAKVEEFITTLKEVLLYEKTPCPFARSFSVDLPEEPSIKKEKKRQGALGPAKKWKLDRANSWKPEDGGEPPGYGDTSEDESDEEERGAHDNAAADNKASELNKRVRQMHLTQPKSPSVKDRIRGLTAASRSFTAPPPLSSQAFRSRTKIIHETDSIESEEPREQHQRSLQAIPTDMPPSPPDSSIGFDVPEIARADDEQSFDDSVLVHTIEGVDNVVQPQTEGGADLDDRVDDEVIPAVETSELTSAGRVEASEPDETRQPSMIDDLETARDEEVLSAAGLNESVAIMADADGDNPGSGPELSHVLGDHPQLHSSTSHKEIREQSSAMRPADENPDPFAQIQARIQARRSIGGTTSFHPTNQIPTTRQSSRSTTSASSGASSSSFRSSVSRRSQAPPPRTQQAFASALVRKACSTFLGPPAHLVAVMLRIAARFANGAFGEIFTWDSPGMRERRRVPGSFNLDGSDIDDLSDAEGDEEDDFGIPLTSPVRRVARHDALTRSGSEASVTVGLRSRNGWEVD